MPSTKVRNVKTAIAYHNVRRTANNFASWILVQNFDSAVAGVDLLFERGLRKHYILEVNAFGDFFPGWTDARGRSIHSIEIEETAARFAVG